MAYFQLPTKVNGSQTKGIQSNPIGGDLSPGGRGRMGGEGRLNPSQRRSWGLPVPLQGLLRIEGSRQPCSIAFLVTQKYSCSATICLRAATPLIPAQISDGSSLGFKKPQSQQSPHRFFHNNRTRTLPIPFSFADTGVSSQFQGRGRVTYPGSH